MNNFENKIKNTVAGKLFAFTNNGTVLYEKQTGKRFKVLKKNESSIIKSL